MFSNLFAASAWAGRYLGEYFSIFTSLAILSSLRLTYPFSNLLDSSKRYCLILLKSLELINSSKILDMTVEVKGIPSLLTVSIPFPSYFGDDYAFS